jgi:prepilin-type N-terminal cleavage/methylation domain-containing protein
MTKIRSEKSVMALPLCRTSAGFTLIEMLIAIAIIAILTAISYPIYTNSLDKAKRTKGISTLETVRKSIEDYHINHNSYPPAIDITTGLDGSGNVVLAPQLVSEFNSNLASLDSYVPTSDDYTLTARATDSKHTVLILRSGSVIAVGP